MRGNMNIRGFSVAFALVVTACGQGDSGAPTSASKSRGKASGAATADVPSTPPPMPGLEHVGDQLTLHTDQFTIEPGQEKYMCWTVRAPESVKVASFSKEAQPYVHHLLLNTTTKDEPDGMHECDSVFQLSWRPMFAAGAGKVEVAFPENVVDPIDQNTQLLLQMHLLNTGDEPVTDSTTIVMNLSNSPSTESVSIGAFGNTDIDLQPGQPGTVVAECDNPVTRRVVGFFPHMHMLGKSMTFEMGPTADDMRMVYQRTPYDFNDQRVDQTDMMIDANAHVRVTCNYQNTRQQAVTFGESSFDEMCFLVLFVVGGGTGCIQGSAPLTSGM
jgi:hypothetical protein